MATKSWAVILIILTTFLISISQVLWKKGADILEFNLTSILTNYYIIGGLILYAFITLLILIAYKGGDVNVLNPLIATSYIWTTILSVILFNDILNILKVFGISIIILGVGLVGYGGRHGN